MHKTVLETAIEQRTAEVAGYQTNIDNYTAMIEKIPGDWCEKTAPYRGFDTQKLANATDDEELMLRVADLNFRDSLRVTVRAERIEQRKAMLVLSVLQDQLKGE
jgi:hypothetical protein